VTGCRRLTREKGNNKEKPRKGRLDRGLSRFRFGGTCDGRERHHSSYVASELPETTPVV